MCEVFLPFVLSFVFCFSHSEHYVSKLCHEVKDIVQKDKLPEYSMKIVETLSYFFFVIYFIWIHDDFLTTLIKLTELHSLWLNPGVLYRNVGSVFYQIKHTNII